MFKRFIRVIKAFVNTALEQAEDPVVMLKSNIKEYKDQIVRFNQGLVQAHASIELLETEYKEACNEEKVLENKIKLSAEYKKEKVGVEFAKKLILVRRTKERTELALKEAKSSYKKLKELRSIQLTKVRNEIDKIKSKIKEAKVAKLEGDVAELFQAFEVNGLTDTNERMLEKLDEQSATNKSKLKVASESIDWDTIKLEREQEDIDAKALYQQYI